MKNKGFTIIEALVIIAIVSILIGMFLPAIQYTRNHTEIPRPTQILEDVQNDVDVIVKVQGKYDGWPYIIFVDKATKTRILYYRGAMTYLKPKTNTVLNIPVEVD